MVVSSRQAASRTHLLLARRWDCNEKNLKSESEGPVVVATAPLVATDWKTKMRLYAELGKPRLSALVVLTTMFGYCVAPGPFVLATFLGSAGGTAMFAVAASCVNQIAERDLDAKMVRTRSRPLPSGGLSVAQAAGLCAATTAGGALLLGASSPAACVALGLANVVLYGFVYTPLKQRTTLNTPIGALVGAIPPVIGWVAGGGGADLGLVALATLLYAWQMPHFHSLAFNLKEDYRRGNYKMLVLEHEERIPLNIALHTLAIAPLGALFAYQGVTDWGFAVTSLVPVAWFMYHVRQFGAHPHSHAHARAVFLTSVRFLPVYMLLLLVHHLLYEHFKSRSDETTVVDK